MVRSREEFAAGSLYMLQALAISRQSLLDASTSRIPSMFTAAATQVNLAVFSPILRLLQSAEVRFRRALSAAPNNHVVLSRLAHCLRHTAVVFVAAAGQRADKGQVLAEAQAIMAKANDLFAVLRASSGRDTLFQGVKGSNQVRRVISAVFGDEHRFGIGNFNAPMMKLVKQLSETDRPVMKRLGAVPPPPPPLPPQASAEHASVPVRRRRTAGMPVSASAESAGEVGSVRPARGSNLGPPRSMGAIGGDYRTPQVRSNYAAPPRRPQKPLTQGSPDDRVVSRTTIDNIGPGTALGMSLGAQFPRPAPAVKHALAASALLSQSSGSGKFDGLLPDDAAMETLKRCPSEGTGSALSSAVSTASAYSVGSASSATSARDALDALRSTKFAGLGRFHSPQVNWQ